MERSFRAIAGFLFAAFLFSCNLNNVQDFRMGSNFVNSTSGVVLIDTMQMVSSTVHLDSIVTSKLSRLLVGGYQNSLTGNVTSSAYFQVGNSSFPTVLPTDMVFDSLVVRYLYDGYYMGDTTRLIKFNVKRLDPRTGTNSNGTAFNTAAFRTDLDGNLYSCDTFKLASENLGQIQLYPHPTYKRECFFRLSDDYGKMLFNNVINRNDTLSNPSYFRLFLPGLAFVSPVNQNQSAIGISQKSISMRLYYHEMINTAEPKVPTYFNFPVNTSGIWYNHISYNSTGSLLGTISQPSNPLLSSNEVPSTSTFNQAMVQGGSGIYTKIRIPGSGLLKGYAKNLILISAQIQLTPLLGTYTTTNVRYPSLSNNPLPDTLAVYVVDRRNVIARQYSSSVGSNIFARKVIPIAFNQQPYYLLDATSFFASEMASTTITGYSLMIGTVGAKAGMVLNPFAFAPFDSSGHMFKLSVFCYIDKVYNN